MQWGEGRAYRAIAQNLGLSPPTALRAVRRYRAEGEAGLVDRRADNGERRIDEELLGALAGVLRDRASDHGWPRPTWTRELLALTLAQGGGEPVSVATISRALARIGARRGRPRPVVSCPLSPRQQRRRRARIRQLLQGLPSNEVLLYEDEVDLHLNPKIGLDWMLRATQREAVTPGRNQKAYLAGALDARTGQLHVVEGRRKDTGLFLALLEHLLGRYPDARRIHLVLDNYAIHHGRRARAWLRDHGGRLQLHFLPPYSPQDNPIERVWQDLHAHVTRNHTRRSLRWLLHDVRRYVKARNAQSRRCGRRAA